MFRKIIISRTDSIGDVMLTLPLCGWIKQLMPEVSITFLGKYYTAPVVGCCKHIDDFIDADKLNEEDPQEFIRALEAQKADAIVHVFPDTIIMKLAKQANIPIRVATSGRWSSWIYCNRRAFFSRKNSDLHESQLNLKLLQPLGINCNASTEELGLLYGFRPRASIPNGVVELFNNQKKLVILHPFSKGSAAEWGLSNFSELSHKLHGEGFGVAVCGTLDDGRKLSEHFHLFHHQAVDLCGRLSLDEYITLISSSYALVAASTGPLHIAAACGIRAIGLYSPMRPIHPGRWKPIGKQAFFIEAPSHPVNREYLDIAPDEVMRLLSKP